MNKEIDVIGWKSWTEDAVVYATATWESCTCLGMEKGMRNGCLRRM